MMGDKEGTVIVKDEQKQSPTYHRASLYADDVTTHLNAEHLYNDGLRHAQHGVSRHCQWNEAGNPVMDSSKSK